MVSANFKPIHRVYMPCNNVARFIRAGFVFKHKWWFVQFVHPLQTSYDVITCSFAVVVSNDYLYGFPDQIGLKVNAETIEQNIPAAWALINQIAEEQEQ